MNVYSILIKRYPLSTQLILYAFVGALCSIADILLFYIFYLLSDNVIISSIISFSIATGINYLLSRKHVFMPGKYEVPSEILRLFIVSVIGLILNTLIVYFLTQYFMLPPVLSKVIAIPLLFFWNFALRKFFVFHKNLPLK